MTSSVQAPVTLDVWVDIACPWCFVGHRHLDAAVPRDSADVVVVHRAFQLQPTMPSRGKPYAEFMAGIFGGADRIEAASEPVMAAGRQAGIAFDFASMPVAPNTEMAHRALSLVLEPRLQRAAVDALFSALFEQARDITDVAVVVDVVAAATGLDPTALSSALDCGQGAESVAHDLREAAELGISAVPTFVADMSVAVQGAQPPEVLRRVIDQARASSDPEPLRH